MEKEPCDRGTIFICKYLQPDQKCCAAANCIELYCSENLLVYYGLYRSYAQFRLKSGKQVVVISHLEI